jgi:hypothetical protein
VVAEEKELQQRKQKSRSSKEANEIILKKETRTEERSEED